jgi:hypothetical protein
MVTLLIGNEDFDDDNPLFTQHRLQLPRVSRIFSLLLPKTSVGAPFPALLRTQTPNCFSVLGSSLSKKMVLHLESESWSIAVFIDALLVALFTLHRLHLPRCSRISSLLLPKTSVGAPFPALLRTQTPNCFSVLGSSLSKKMVLHPESESWSIVVFIDALLVAGIFVAPFLSAATGDATDFN